MRRSYNKQFQIAAVKLVLEDDMSVSHAARELSIHYNSLKEHVINTKIIIKKRIQ